MTTPRRDEERRSESDDEPAAIRAQIRSAFDEWLDLSLSGQFLKANGPRRELADLGIQVRFRRAPFKGLADASTDV